MDAAVKASPRYATYAAAVDRESAREMLAAKLEAGAAKAKAEAEATARAEADAKEEAAAAKSTKSTASRKQDGGVVSDVVNSGAFKDFMRTAAREIARGMFKSGRR